MQDNAKLELEIFKRTKLQRFLPALGFSPKDKKPIDAALEWTDGTATIKLFTGANGFERWKDFTSGASGTVIDIAMEKTGNLGRARELMRSILGSAAPQQQTAKPQEQVHTSPQPVPFPPAHDESGSPEPKRKLTSDEVKAAYCSGSEAWTADCEIPKILRDRGICKIRQEMSKSFRVTMSGRIVTPTFKIDESGASQYAGFETRGADGKKYYLEGGSAGVWVSDTNAKSKVAIIAESVIECLSYDIVHPLSGGQTLIAVRSGAEADAANLLRLLIASGRVEKVIYATNNDPAGLLYAAKIGAAIAKTGIFQRFRMPDGWNVDWNDVLNKLLSDDDAIRPRLEAEQDFRGGPGFSTILPPR